MTAPISIDLESFSSRIDKVRALWKTWLLGYEFPETVMAISKDRIAFLTSVRKASILKQLADSLSSDVCRVFGREKEAGKGQSVMEEFWSWIAPGDSEEVLKVGSFGKDKTEGPMYSEWQAFYANVNGMKEDVEIASSFSSLLSNKDVKEVECVELAGKTLSLLMKELMAGKVLAAIDEGKKVTHSQLTENIEGQISDQLGRYRSKLPSKLNMDMVDICYPPIIQSGGHYSLKPSAISNDERLSYNGVILCSLGIRYKSYCSNIGRTLLVDPSKKQEEELAFLLELESFVIDKMSPGTPLSKLYEMAMEFVHKRKPELERHLTSNLGFGMGIEFRESEFLISQKSVRPIEEGMVFNLAIGFQGLNDPNSSFKDQIYALLVADTIHITGNGAERLTDALPSLKELSYSFKSEGAKRSKSSAVDLTATSNIRTRLRNHQADITAEKKRKEHQKNLMIESTREMLEKYTEEAEGDDGESGKEKKAQVVKFESYRKEANFPRDACKDWKIVVDKRAESVILPIQGFAVPFHISTIKNVTKNDEGDFVCLRFNFNTPGRTFGKKDESAQPFWDNPLAEFIRGMVFRSSDAPRVQETFKAIQDLRKQVIERENAQKEMSDLVEQASLIEITGRRPARLVDVYMRPSLETRRTPGDVEIHSNGIRYRNQLKSDQRIDVLFSNVKHCFFQPCDHESIVIVHLHLHHPIMVGKKKTKDVQFYREAIDSLVDETSGRRTRMRFGDEDEIAQEAEERKRRAEANAEFKAFTERLAEASKNHKLDVDVPFRDLGFTGIVSKQSVLLQPTTDCLIQVVEPPFLVVTLGDVEIAYLERVMFGLKNFDLVFVFKDHSRPPVSINSVPTSSLEAVKDWLDSVDVVYAESKINFNWSNVLKTIKEDPIDFYENGGWASLQPDENDSDEEDEDEQSSAYEPEDEDEEAFEESEDEDEDEEEESEEEEEESDFDDEEESDSEDAPDWDDLEEEAAREDARRETSSSNKRKAQPAKKPVPRRK